MTSDPTHLRHDQTVNADGTVDQRRSATPAEREPTAALLAVMAHSLLNSVAAIKTASAMLDERDDLNDRQIDTVVDVITAQSDHLYEMVKDLVRTGDPALMFTLAELDGARELDVVPA